MDFIAREISNVPSSVIKRFFFGQNSKPIESDQHFIVSFAPDGDYNEASIESMNAAVPELEPLFDAVRKFCPGQYAIPSPTKMSREQLIESRVVKPLASARREISRQIDPDDSEQWWCLWPRVLGEY